MALVAAPLSAAHHWSVAAARCAEHVAQRGSLIENASNGAVWPLLSTGLVASYVKSARPAREARAAITFPAAVRAEGAAINHALTRCCAAAVTFAAHTHREHVDFYSWSVFLFSFKSKNPAWAAPVL